MTSRDFVIWLKGFVAASHNYNITPKQWDELREQLNTVNDKSVSPDDEAQDWDIFKQQKI
jgi:hypothetical protein